MGKPNLTILVSNFRIVQVIENVLYAMFVFWRGYVHPSKNVFYRDDNIVLSFVYKVPDVNPGGMFWTVTNGKYQIISKNVLNNFQDIVVYIHSYFMANIVTKNVLMKEKPIAASHDSKFFVPIVKSLFINLCDSFDEDNLSPPDVIVLVSVNSKIDE